MAVAFDANLGSSAYNHAATGTTGSPSGVASWNTGTHTITTSAAVAAGGKVFVGIMYYGTTLTTTGASGGGLTWRVARHYQGANFDIVIVEADAPAGLASSTAITVSHTNSGGGGIWGMSFTGLATGAVNDNGVSGAATNWTVTSLDTTGDGLTVAFTATLANGTAGTYNSPTGGSTEVHDFGHSGGPVGLATQYQARTGAGSYTETGTVSIGTAFNQQIGLAINAAGGAAETPPPNLVMSPYAGAY